MGNTVDNIIRSLVKTTKAIQMYGVNHPSATNFYKPFYEMLSDYLKENHELELQIEQFSILHAGHTVYEEKEKDISIAFRLFRDGIRNISFNDGLTFEELLIFLESISQATKEQDIALNLWEGDFTHMNFYVVEEEDHILDYKIPEVPVQNIDYDVKFNEIITREKIDLNKPLISDLQPEELNALKEDVKKTEKMSMIPSALMTFVSFLKTEKSREILDGLTELIKECIDDRDFYSARRAVHILQDYPDINVIQSYENEATIIGFANVINTASDEIFNEFIAFIGFFSRKSIPHFLKLTSRVKRQDRLLALRHRIAYITQGDTAIVSSFLVNEDTSILMNAIAILGLLKSKDIVDLLQPLMNHQASIVRAEIILALENIEKATMIATFLDDENTTVRIKALQSLARLTYPRGYDDLLRRVRNKYFRDLEFVEQKEYFNCLVASGGKEITKHLKKILFKWLLFGHKKYSVMRKLAATALTNVGTDEAQKVLSKGTKKRNKDIKTACEMALRQR